MTASQVLPVSENREKAATDARGRCDTGERGGGRLLWSPQGWGPPCRGGSPWWDTLGFPEGQSPVRGSGTGPSQHPANEAPNPGVQTSNRSIAGAARALNG